MAPVVVSRAVGESRFLRTPNVNETSRTRFTEFQRFNLTQPDHDTGPKPKWTPNRGIPQPPGTDEVPEHSRNPWAPGKITPQIRRRPEEDQPTIRLPPSRN